MNGEWLIAKDLTNYNHGPTPFSNSLGISN